MRACVWQELHSDIIHPERPSLEDLGVSLQPFEFVAHEVLRVTRPYELHEDPLMEDLMELPPIPTRHLNKTPIHDHYLRQEEFYKRAMEREDVKRYWNMIHKSPIFNLQSSYEVWHKENVRDFKAPPKTI